MNMRNNDDLQVGDLIVLKEDDVCDNGPETRTWFIFQINKESTHERYITHYCNSDGISISGIKNGHKTFNNPVFVRYRAKDNK